MSFFHGLYAFLRERLYGPAGNDVLLMARLVSADGTGTAVDEEGNALKQADVSTITCAVYDLHATRRGVTVATPTVTVASAILDTLTDDDLWDEDTTGYNFKHNIAGATLATAGHTYRVVYTLTTTGGTVMKWAYEINAIGLVPG